MLFALIASLPDGEKPVLSCLLLRLMHLMSDGIWQVRTTFGPINPVA